MPPSNKNYILCVHYWRIAYLAFTIFSYLENSLDLKQMFAKNTRKNLELFWTRYTVFKYLSGTMRRTWKVLCYKYSYKYHLHLSIVPHSEKGRRGSSPQLQYWSPRCLHLNEIPPSSVELLWELAIFLTAAIEITSCCCVHPCGIFPDCCWNAVLFVVPPQ